MFRTFISAQYTAFSHLMVIVNYGDQTYYTLTMKKYKDDGLLDDSRFNEITAKINKVWAYTSSIHEIMKNVPNYKDKFEKLLTPKYQQDYQNALIGIFLHLDELDPATQGKNIEKCAQKKGLNLGNATYVYQIVHVASRIQNVMSILSDKTYEFENEFALMDYSYYRFSCYRERQKRSVLESIPKFSSKLDDFLNSVDKYGEAVKKELKEVSKEVLPPILEVLYVELHNLPSELSKACEQKSTRK